MPVWNYLAVLLCAGLIAEFRPTSADENVNLFFPNIVEAKFKRCWRENRGCNISVSTPAAKYELIGIDFATGESGLIKRVGTWQEPSLEMNETVSLGSDRLNFNELVEKAANLLEADSSDYLKSPGFMVCDASTSFVNSNVNNTARVFDICIQNLNFSIYEKLIGYHHYVLENYLLASEYIMPITAVTVGRNILFDDARLKELEFEIFAFDISGRAFHVILLLDFSDSPYFKNNSVYRFLELSSIAHPLSKDQSKREWLDRNDFLKNKTEIKQKLTKNLDKKMQVAYVETITPIYRSQLISRPNGNESIAFCISSGYRYHYNSVTKSNIRCSHKGESLNDLIGKPLITEEGPSYFVHAYQILTLQNDTHHHLVYTIKEDDEKPLVRYLHCVQRGINEIGVRRKDHDFSVHSSDFKKVCAVQDNLVSIPDDIIEFKYRDCHKLISFYHIFYSVNNVSQQIPNGPKVRVLKNLYFRIRAAFAIHDEIYFFTRVNKLVIIQATMDTDCKELQLNMSSVRELNSQEFLYKHFSQGKYDEPVVEPFQLGYREYAENADDTMPPLKAKKEPATDYTIYIVIIGVFGGGLLIAATIYLCCLRKRDQTEEPDVAYKLQNQSMLPMPSQNQDLMMLTVRSQQLSSLNTPKQVSKFLKQVQSQASPREQSNSKVSSQKLKGVKDNNRRRKSRSRTKRRGVKQRQLSSSSSSNSRVLPSKSIQPSKVSLSRANSSMKT